MACNGSFTILCIHLQCLLDSTSNCRKIYCNLQGNSLKGIENKTIVQLRGNQKDFHFQLHHRLSKFEVPVVVNLKHIFELFGLYTTCFFIQKLLELIRLSSDGQFWRKRQNKKGWKFELRSQLCYYNCIQNSEGLGLVIAPPPYFQMFLRA